MVFFKFFENCRYQRFADKTRAVVHLIFFDVTVQRLIFFVVERKNVFVCAGRMFHIFLESRAKFFKPKGLFAKHILSTYKNRYENPTVSICRYCIRARSPSGRMAMVSKRGLSIKRAEKKRLKDSSDVISQLIKTPS